MKQPVKKEKKKTTKKNMLSSKGFTKGMSILEKKQFKVTQMYHNATDSESEEEITELKVAALPDYELDD